VLPDQAQALLQLARDRILEPEQIVRLEIASQPRCLAGRATVVHVVQQMKIATVGRTHAIHQLGHEA
jgi:hypothetical protein